MYLRLKTYCFSSPNLFSNSAIISSLTNTFFFELFLSLSFSNFSTNSRTACLISSVLLLYLNGLTNLSTSSSRSESIRKLIVFIIIHCISLYYINLAKTLQKTQFWLEKPCTPITKENIFNRSQKIAQTVGTDFEKINIKSYIGPNDRKSFQLMAELYGEQESEQLKKKFRDLYQEGRKIYSTKDDVAFPYVRPCQICRKVVIKAYYAEAIKRNIPIIFIGINEWTGLSDNKLSAIRKLRPFKDRPPAYIVHLPFLLQRSSNNIKPILKKIKWKQPKGDSFIETGASTCYLARACEHKAKKMLGFHIDSILP